jgi:hypothetical protein
LTAVKKNRPQIGDVKEFTEFIHNKWRKFADQAELKKFGKKHENYDTYVNKLCHKITTGAENCKRVMDKRARLGTPDGEKFRRRRSDEKPMNETSLIEMSTFQRKLMHEFHKKVSERESARAEKGMGSKSLTHWWTHIMRKFQQVMDFHILQCVDIHDNIRGRYTKIKQRRHDLHKKGMDMLQERKEYFERIAQRQVKKEWKLEQEKRAEKAKQNAQS